MDTSLQQSSLPTTIPDLVDGKLMPMDVHAPPSPPLSSHDSFDELPSRARTPAGVAMNRTPRSTRLLETFVESHRNLHKLQSVTHSCSV